MTRTLVRCIVGVLLASTLSVGGTASASDNPPPIPPQNLPPCSFQPAPSSSTEFERSCGVTVTPELRSFVDLLEYLTSALSWWQREQAETIAAQRVTITAQARTINRQRAVIKRLRSRLASR